MKQALNTQSSKHAVSNKCNAFHGQATLEEVAEADVLIHVMDGSSPQMLQQRQAVMHILRQLGKRDLPTRPRATGLICVPVLQSSQAPVSVRNSSSVACMLLVEKWARPTIAASHPVLSGQPVHHAMPLLGASGLTCRNF